METTHVEFPVIVLDRPFTVPISKHAKFGKTRPWCAHAMVDGTPVEGRGRTSQEALEDWKNKAKMRLDF